MISKTTFLVVVLIKTITSQRLPFNYPLYPEPVYAAPPLSPSDNDVVCKNLASAIQNVIFDRFAQNCLRTPIFGPISTPLINEIKSSLCTCPLCSKVNISPNGYSKSYVSPNAVSNVIKSSVPNVISRDYPSITTRGKPNVCANKNIDLMSLIKSLSTCDCGCMGPIVV